jgi:hypothetical protein
MRVVHPRLDEDDDPPAPTYFLLCTRLHHSSYSSLTRKTTPGATTPAHAMFDHRKRASCLEYPHVNTPFLLFASRRINDGGQGSVLSATPRPWPLRDDVAPVSAGVSDDQNPHAAVFCLAFWAGDSTSTRKRAGGAARTPLSEHSRLTCCEQPPPFSPCRPRRCRRGRKTVKSPEHDARQGNPGQGEDA